MRPLAVLLTALVGCTNTPFSTDGDTDVDDPATSSGSSATSGASSATSGSPTSTDTGSYQCEAGELSGGVGDSSDDSSMGIGDDMPLVASIPDIRQGAINLGTWVLLEDVVIISPKTASEWSSDSEFFVQDPAGGPWSGLRLRTGPLETIPAEGEAVDVVGRVRSGPGGRMLDVVIPDEDIVGLGPVELPPPTLVSIDDLAVATAQDNPYEGIGIRVEQVAVTDDDPCEGEFVIEDIARVDDRYAPAQIEAPTTGTMLAAVEGVLIFAGDALEIAPLDPSGVQ